MKILVQGSISSLSKENGSSVERHGGQPATRRVPKMDNGTLKTKYQLFSPRIYEEMQAVLASNVTPGSKILDLGPYEGNNEVFLDGLGLTVDIDCVDIDEEALKVLSAKPFKNISVQTTLQDGNEFLDAYDKQVDIVLSSASIHELNESKNQWAYMNWFFRQANRILVPGGKVIIGDLYFPDSISDEVVEEFREWQWEAIHHASSREQFVYPELIEETSLANGFELVSKKEIRAMREIDRRYYVFVLEKV
jgi:SAM-dependent methyltransferase